MNIAAKTVTGCAFLLGLTAGFAQQNPAQPPRDVVQLSASAALEVPQDFLMLTLSTTREGPDAQGVQEQLKAVLDAALSEAKKSAQPDAMEVRTGQFSLTPQYGRDGHIIGWRGSAQLLLQGQDMSAGAAAAARATLAAAVISLGIDAERATGAVAAKAAGPSSKDLENDTLIETTV